MTTNKEVAAYVAASLTVSLGLKTVLEATNVWEQLYETVLEKLGPDKTPPAPPVHNYSAERVTEGGRRMPIVNQDDIQEKIAEVFVAKGRIIPVRSGDLPKDAQKWAEDRGFAYLYDNRWAQKENPKRPAFKAVDDRGNDIKDETGKSISFWGDKR